MWLYVMIAGILLGCLLTVWFPMTALIGLWIVGALVLLWAHAKDDLAAMWDDAVQFGKDILKEMDRG